MERMVGHWFHWLSDFATTWLPLAFFGILILTAWLLFKTVGMMPRVRPSTIDNRSRSHVTWSDVAGVEEVRAELMEVVDFLRDRQMLVPPPDLSGREAILGVHTRSKPLGPDVDLNQVARQTSGLTGAELANICNEAAIFAGRRSDAYVTQSDFDNAIERVVAGLQQKKVLTEKERRILAFHEGGHAHGSTGSPRRSSRRRRWSARKSSRCWPTSTRSRARPSRSASRARSRRSSPAPDQDVATDTIASWRRAGSTMSGSPSQISTKR